VYKRQVVLGGAPSQNVEEPDDDDLLRQLQVLQDEGASASDAARQLAQTTGLSRRRLYALLHQGTSN
jgi:16S rRNA (cytidine1402-2'-O)-methyltransferase